MANNWIKQFVLDNPVIARNAPQYNNTVMSFSGLGSFLSWETAGWLQLLIVKRFLMLDQWDEIG